MAPFPKIFSEENVLGYFSDDDEEREAAESRINKTKKAFEDGDLQDFGREHRDYWIKEFDFCRIHLTHLRKQASFFSAHDQVASVHLITKRGGKGVKIVPYVRVHEPTGLTDEDMENYRAEALGSVYRDLLREFGQILKEGEVICDGDSKQAMFTSFNDAGISFDWPVELKPLENPKLHD